jgi:20S proteasome alpha/beta subunit
MTVCIGAICDGGKAVVVATDRMMTFGPPMNLQAEGAVRKILTLSDNAVILFSGSVPDGEAVAHGTRAFTKDGTYNLRQMSEFAAKAYQDLKGRRVEDSILRPLLGIDFAKFQQLVSQSASSQVLGQVLGMISQHNLNLDIILAGIDDENGHLSIITHPGTALLMDIVGFSAIGSGGMHASVRLSLGRQTKGLSIPETIFNVYEAKRASEVAPGVGRITDIAVLSGKTVKFLSEPVFEVLSKIEKERPSLQADDLKRLREVCGDAQNDPAKA